MSLVNEKKIISRNALPKETLQIHMRVEEIVVITDNGIRKQTGIQAHLKGTDHMLFRISPYSIPAIALLIGQHVENGIVNPVIMPFCVRAVLRIAFRLLHKADFLLGGQDDAFHPQALAPQNLYGLLRHSSGDGLGRQIEEFLSHVSSHGLDCRIDCGKRLAHSRRRLQEKFLLMINGAVHMGGQLLLSLSVRIGEFQPLNRSRPDSLPFPRIIRPLPVSSKQVQKPRLKLPEIAFLMKIANLPGWHMAVGQAHPNAIQPFFLTV